MAADQSNHNEGDAGAAEGYDTHRPPARAYVLYPYLKSQSGERRSPEARLEEAEGLARAIDLDIRYGEAIPVSSWRPSTLIGSGKLDELAKRLEAEPAELIVVDAAVTPGQQRNLEKALKAKVIDRTGLILEIFGARARTREGRLQVELAHLTYQRSRLVRSWTHLERQRGGFGFLGGPGESQLEIDRRLIGERISRIKEDLGQVTTTRGLHRRARQKVPYPVVALVGYTNAGKSTLFNRLTKADVFAKDLLFATLDPTMRQIALPSGRKAILSDTVGFISELPTHLVAAFRATLEEVIAADLIVHVRDLSHPDTEAQNLDVRAVLASLGITEETGPRQITAWNKIDRLEAAERESLLNQAERIGALAISALTGEGMDDLLARVDKELTDDRVKLELDLDPADGAALAWLHRHGEVRSMQERDGRLKLDVMLPKLELGRWEKRRAVSASGGKPA